MHTWHDIARVRDANPDYRLVDIARELGCHHGWVRATFYRRGWPIPVRKLAYDPAAVIAGYRAGDRIREIAAANGISRAHVIQVLDKHAPGLVSRRRRVQGVSHV